MPIRIRYHDKLLDSQQLFDKKTVYHSFSKNFQGMLYGLECRILHVMRINLIIVGHMKNGDCC